MLRRTKDDVLDLPPKIRTWLEVDVREGTGRRETREVLRALIGRAPRARLLASITKARQVVFNDLDWTPANHWQAEDRAYRIGQTNTVNVTYLLARDTIDGFVAHALAVYRLESGSRPGTFYTLDVDGPDVTCSCPGFEYRGNCSHARQLKDALAKGGSAPDGFEAVVEGRSS
jgi:SWIM zinc finger